MHFLNDTTLEAIVGQDVTVVVDTKRQQVSTITAKAFLQDGRFFIDCVPALRRKYVTPVPDDAIISSSDRPDKPWRYGIIIRAESDAGKFIQRLLDAKTISNN
jgi:hypothetical protein